MIGHQSNIKRGAPHIDVPLETHAVRPLTVPLKYMAPFVDGINYQAMHVRRKYIAVFFQIPVLTRMNIINQIWLYRIIAVPRGIGLSMPDDPAITASNPFAPRSVPGAAASLGRARLCSDPLQAPQPPCARFLVHDSQLPKLRLMPLIATEPGARSV